MERGNEGNRKNRVVCCLFVWNSLKSLEPVTIIKQTVFHRFKTIRFVSVFQSGPYKPVVKVWFRQPTLCYQKNWLTCEGHDEERVVWRNLTGQLRPPDLKNTSENEFEWRLHVLASHPTSSPELIHWWRVTIQCTFGQCFWTGRREALAISWLASCYVTAVLSGREAAH